MPASKTTRTFSKSFKPYVELRDAETCSLKRHFQGALRQVVGYIDLLAANDPERFVWASVADIAGHCLDYDTKEKYQPRIVKYCKNWLRYHGIIGDQITRERNGITCPGFIVLGHEQATKLVANQCVFSMKCAPMSAPICAPPSALASAPLCAPQNENLCTPECTSEPPQAIENTRGCEGSQKVFPEFSESFTSPNLVTLSTYEPIEPLEPGQIGKTVPEKNDHNSNSFSNSFVDLTNPEETIADRFDLSESLQNTVLLLSDGEYDISSSRSYEHLEELEDALRQTIQEMERTPFNGRNTCAEIMDRTMRNLRERFDLNTPRPWLRVLKKLRNDGGPTVFSKSKTQEREQNAPNVLSKDSALGQEPYKTRLEPFKEILVETARHEEIPLNWTRGADFLNHVLKQHPNRDLQQLTIVRDELLKR